MRTEIYENDSAKLVACSTGQHVNRASGRTKGNDIRDLQDQLLFSSSLDRRHQAAQALFAVKDKRCLKLFLLIARCRGEELGLRCVCIEHLAFSIGYGIVREALLQLLQSAEEHEWIHGSAACAVVNGWQMAAAKTRRELIPQVEIIAKSTRRLSGGQSVKSLVAEIAKEGLWPRDGNSKNAGKGG